MNAYDFGRQRVEKLREESRIFSDLFDFCGSLPGYKELKFLETSRTRGKIEYEKRYAVIEFNPYEGDMELTLAHEIMHYILVLQGAKLPMLKENYSCDEVRLIYKRIMNGCTHHPLLAMELQRFGYRDKLHDESTLMYQPILEAERNMDQITNDLLLYLVDFKSFIFNDNPLEKLKRIFLHKNHEELFNLFLNQEINIEGVNNLTSNVISYFGMNDYIHLAVLEDYVTRDDTYV
ncbi:hypothetical protein COF09_11175 [Bacillus toyonensis]|uniref:hypothetical protein n=1 Tax=Bacillus toyonensis TaxID=155322 RepID=UPI000BFC835D|nr:hypothetical protein [Bacillus toyonensis]PHC43817.1 hypothetical protein COF09_11175 [Bacillus toyonensis]